MGTHPSSFPSAYILVFHLFMLYLIRGMILSAKPTIPLQLWSMSGGPYRRPSWSPPRPCLDLSFPAILQYASIASWSFVPWHFRLLPFCCSGNSLFSSELSCLITNDSCQKLPYQVKASNWAVVPHFSILVWVFHHENSSSFYQPSWDPTRTSFLKNLPWLVWKFLLSWNCFILLYRFTFVAFAVILYFSFSITNVNPFLLSPYFWSSQSFLLLLFFFHLPVNDASILLRYFLNLLISLRILFQIGSFFLFAFDFFMPTSPTILIAACMTFLLCVKPVNMKSLHVVTPYSFW